MEFSERLIMLRDNKRPRRSAQATSELIGLERSTLSKYEGGKRLPTAENLALIADYYHVSMDFLWGRENF